MKNILIITTLLFLGCEDKVIKPETKTVATPTICPEPNPETSPSNYSFAGISNVSDITRTSALLNWTPDINFYQYNIIELRGKDRVILAVADKGKSTFKLNNLTPDTEYTFMVRAIDNASFMETNTKTITFKTLPWPSFQNQRSISLNGSQSIELPASSSIIPGKKFTISLWVKLKEALQKDARFFTLHRESFATTALSLGVRANKVSVTYSNKNNELKTVSEEADILDSKWHHLVLTKKNNQLNVYIDNQKVITVKNQISNFGDHPAFIGSYSGIQKGIVAKIDEFSIFNRAFNYRQIIELNNNGLSMDLTEHPQAKHLKLWYQFGDQTSDNTSIITDVIGGRNAVPLNISTQDFVKDSP